MKISKNWVIAVLAGVLVPAGIWAATAVSQMVAPAVTCESGSVCNNYIATAPQGEQAFGTASVDNTTVWAAGEFTDDLAVDGALTVTGASTLTGAVAVTGALTSTSIPNKAVVTMTNATTTPCAVRNTSGVSRVITAIGVKETAGPSVGSVTIDAGIATTAFADPNPDLVQGVLTRSATLDVISTTSTVMSAYQVWKNNDWLTFKSATSVHSGTCLVQYYNQ
jgi:hypothetical protein